MSLFGVHFRKLELTYGDLWQHSEKNCGDSRLISERWTLYFVPFTQRITEPSLIQYFLDLLSNSTSKSSISRAVPEDRIFEGGECKNLNSNLPVQPKPKCRVTRNDVGVSELHVDTGRASPAKPLLLYWVKQMFFLLSVTESKIKIRRDEWLGGGKGTIEAGRIEKQAYNKNKHKR